MTSVLIADDQALVRVGLRKILETEPEITVVGEACDGQDAVGCAHLALMSDLGLGVAKNVAAAIDLYAKACDMGGGSDGCHGGPGTDRLLGGGDPDQLYGDGGNDYCDGGPGVGRSDECESGPGG